MEWKSERASPSWEHISTLAPEMNRVIFAEGLGGARAHHVRPPEGAPPPENCVEDFSLCLKGAFR